MGNPLYCMGCLSCFYVDPIYIDHYLTELFYTNLRLMLQSLPTVFSDRRLETYDIESNIPEPTV